MQISNFMLTTFTIKCLQNLINHRINEQYTRQTPY